MSTGAFDQGALRVPLANVDTGGGIVSLANPEGEDLWVELALLNVTTPATDGICVVNVGVGASATTKYDNLIDGADVGAAPAVYSNTVNGGANGKAGFWWKADQFLTVSTDSGSAAGLVGELSLKAVKL